MRRKALEKAVKTIERLQNWSNYDTIDTSGLLCTCGRLLQFIVEMLTLSNDNFKVYSQAEDTGVCDFLVQLSSTSLAFCEWNHSGGASQLVTS